MSAEATHFVLPARLDGTTASMVAEGLRPLRGQAIDLCGFDVERVGGQGLQVLLAAFWTWSEDGHTLRVVDPSSALSGGLQTLGFPLCDTPPVEELSL